MRIAPLPTARALVPLRPRGGGGARAASGEGARRVEPVAPPPKAQRYRFAVHTPFGPCEGIFAAEAVPDRHARHGAHARPFCEAAYQAQLLAVPETAKPGCAAAAYAEADKPSAPPQHLLAIL